VGREVRALPWEIGANAKVLVTTIPTTGVILAVVATINGVLCSAISPPVVSLTTKSFKKTIFLFFFVIDVLSFDCGNGDRRFLLLPPKL
jgi:hypothetical protein